MAADLNGLGVVITRPANVAGKLESMVKKAHGEPILFPTIAIESNLSPAQLSRELPAIQDADIVIFISVNAVNFFFETGSELLPILHSKHIVAVGAATRAALIANGLDKIHSPEQDFNSEGVLNLPILSDIAEIHIIIVRGKGGREHLTNVLGQRRAKVHYIECYCRVIPTVDKRHFLNDLVRIERKIITLTSKTAAENLVAILGEGHRDKWCHLPLAVFSQRIAKYCSQNLRFAGEIIVSENASDESLLRCIDTWANTAN